MLTEEEQRLFRRLSVFVGGCEFGGDRGSLAALDDGADHVLEGVASLLDKSLLHQIEQRGSRAALQHAGDHSRVWVGVLAATGRDAAIRQLIRYSTWRFQSKPSLSLQGPNQVGWVERLEQEHDNLRAALEWALEDVADERAAARRDIALCLSAALWPFWSMRGYYSEARAFSGASYRQKRGSQCLFARQGLAGQCQCDASARRP